MAKVGEAWVAVHPNAKGFFVELTKQMADERADAKPEDTEYKHKVTPEIDADAWRKAKEAWQKQADEEADAGKGPTQKVRLTPDDSRAAKAAFNKSLRELAADGNRKLKVLVDAETKMARAQIAALEGTPVKVRVSVDRESVEDPAQWRADAIKFKELYEKQRKPLEPFLGKNMGLRITFDEESSKTAAHNAKAYLRALKATLDTDIPVTLKTKQLDDARTKLLDVKNAAQDLGKQKIYLDFELEQPKLDALFDGWEAWGMDDGTNRLFKTIYLEPQLASNYDEGGEFNFTKRLGEILKDRELRVRLKPKIETGFEELLAHLDRFDIDNPDRYEVTVDVKVEGDKRLPAFMQALGDLQKKDHDVKIRVDVDDAELSKLKERLAPLAGLQSIDFKGIGQALKDLPDKQDSVIDVKVNGKNDLKLLAEGLKAVPKFKEVVVKVEVKGLAELAVMSAAVEAIRDKEHLTVKYGGIEIDKDALDAVEVDVNVNGHPDVVALVDDVQKLPKQHDTKVKVTVVGRAQITELKKSLKTLRKTYPVAVKVTVVGRGQITELRTSLERLRKTYPVAVKVTVVGKPQITALRDALKKLPTERAVVVTTKHDELDDLVSAIDDVRDSLSALKAELREGIDDKITVRAEVDSALAEVHLDALTRDRTVKIVPVVAELDDSQLEGLLRDRKVKVGSEVEGTSRAKPVRGEQVERIAESVDGLAGKGDVQKVAVVEQPDSSHQYPVLQRAAHVLARELRESQEDLQLLARRREEARLADEERRYNFIRRAMEKLDGSVDGLAEILTNAPNFAGLSRERATQRLSVYSDAVVANMLDRFETNMFRKAATGGPVPNDRRLTRTFNQASAAKRVMLTHDKELFDQLVAVRRVFAGAQAEIIDQLQATVDGLNRFDHNALQSAAEELSRAARLDRADLRKLASELRNLADTPEFRSGLTDAERDAILARRDGRANAPKRRVVDPETGRDWTVAVERMNKYLQRDLQSGGGRFGMSNFNGRDFSVAADKLDRFAGMWDKSVRGATEARMRDSDFTYALKMGMRQLGLVPSRAAKVLAWGAGHAMPGGRGGDISLPGGRVIKDATQAAGIDIGQFGKGKTSKLGAGMKLAGRAHPAAMVLSGALSGGVTAYRWSVIAGGIAGAVGLVTDSVAGLSAQLVGVLKPFGQAMKGVVVAPAMLASLATSVGAVAMSMGGMGDALKALGDEEAFAEALGELTPSAQEFAKAIKALHGPMGDLRKDMQENMFDGMADEFTAMTDNLFPIIQREWPKTARVMGDLVGTMMDTLATPESARRVQSTFEGINESLRLMEPGMRDFTNGLVRMVEVGAREALPSLGRAFSSLGEKFDTYFSEDRLVRWIDASKHGFKEVGGMLADLGAGLGDFMKGMAAGADASFGEGGVWGAMRGALQDFREFAASDEGQQKIITFFEGATDTVRQVTDIFGEWGASIVNDVIPATREFMADHGETIKQLGTDVLQFAAASVETLGPLVEAMAAIMGVANNIAGGPGSERRANKLDKRSRKDSEWLDKKWSKGIHDDEFAVIKDGKRQVKQDKVDERKAEMVEFIDKKRTYLDKFKSSTDTAEWLQVADAMSRANLQLQMLEGGFAGAKQSAEATAAVMTMLGDRIVNIPDSKTIEIEADRLDRAVTALQSLGAKVEEIEDKPGMLRVEFENEMEINGALAQLKTDMASLSDDEIAARGLDVALEQLARLKAQLDGMGDAEVAVNVSADQVDEVIAKLREVGVTAQAIDGSVYLDTNVPEVREWLESINAGSEINGNFVLDSNADEIIAKALQLDGQDVTTNHTVQSNVDEQKAKTDSLATQQTTPHHVESDVDATAQKTNSLATPVTTPHTVNSNVGSILNSMLSLSQPITTVHTIMKQVIGQQADGGIVTPMAAGGILPKHRDAQIAPGGSYILWAENETGGESYIPHAPAKRKRSTRILAETAQLFGMSLVNAEGAQVTPMALGGVKYGDPRTRRLVEQNRKRALEEALLKAERKNLERERDLKGTKRVVPDGSPEAQLEAARKRNRSLDEGYARKMTGYERGRFVYTDVDPSDAEAVRSVDREGLIPERVRISDSIEDWSELDGRSIGIIRAMDSDVYATRYEAPMRGRLSEMERWALEQGLDPAQVRSARRAVDAALPMSDLPPEVQAALLSGEEVNRGQRWHRDIDTEKLWKSKGSFDEIDWGLIGKYVQGWYGDDLADQIGLNARIARDLPLYNLVNPDDETWNAALTDIRGGKRHVEKEYKQRYQTERDIMRDAQKEEKQRQKDRDRAKRKPDQVRKELERELAKERDSQAQRAAGLSAVREHRAAMASQQQGQGVVVNQTIGNITAADAGEAAAKFRRKTMVGFENLTGVYL